MIVSCPSCKTQYDVDDAELTQVEIEVVCDECDEAFIISSEPDPFEEEDDDLSTDDGQDLRALFDEDEDDLDTEDGTGLVQVDDEENEDDFETVIETSAMRNAFLDERTKSQTTTSGDSKDESSPRLQVMVTEPYADQQNYTIGPEAGEDAEDWDTDIGEIPFADYSEPATNTPSELSIAFIPSESETEEEWEEDEDTDDLPTAPEGPDVLADAHQTSESSTHSEFDANPDSSEEELLEETSDDASDEEIVRTSLPQEPGLLPRPRSRAVPPQTTEPGIKRNVRILISILILFIILALSYFYLQYSAAQPSPASAPSADASPPNTVKPQKESAKPPEVGIQSPSKSN